MANLKIDSYLVNTQTRVGEVLDFVSKILTEQVVVLTIVIISKVMLEIAVNKNCGANFLKNRKILTYLFLSF